MPNISTEELLRLRLTALFAPRIAERRMHPATLSDVVRRAMAAGPFTLGRETGELMGGDSDYAADEYLDALEAEEGAEFLFQKFDSPAPAADQRRASEAERISQMTSLQKLEYANRQTLAKRQRDGHG